MPSHESAVEVQPDIRVEVIGNRAIQDDFFDAIEARGLAVTFSLWPEVQGSGASGPRRGDHVWPEENFVFVRYSSRDEARAIKDEVEIVRERYPGAGIAFFATRTVDLE